MDIITAPRGLRREGGKKVDARVGELAPADAGFPYVHMHAALLFDSRLLHRDSRKRWLTAYFPVAHMLLVYLVILPRRLLGLFLLLFDYFARRSFSVWSAVSAVFGA